MRAGTLAQICTGKVVAGTLSAFVTAASPKILCFIIPMATIKLK